MSQPFYDGKKAAEEELNRRMIEDRQIPKSDYKIKAEVVYTYEPTSNITLI